jgi:uncharacterized membrane protein
MATTLPTTKGDPAASALATYLAVFGMSVAVASLSDWLAVMPVLALEIGSALALVLFNGMRVGTGVPKQPGTQDAFQAARFSRGGVPSVSEGMSEGSAQEPQKSEPVEFLGEARNARLKVALVAHLKNAGGSLRIGQRALAKTLGASTTELHRTLHALAAMGVIALNAAPTGTELRLVA